MKRSSILGIVLLSLNFTGCKSDYERLSDLTERGDSVTKIIEAECTDQSMDDPSHFGGVYSTPGSPENVKWKRDLQEAQAHQAALNQSQHCQQLEREERQISDQILSLNQKVRSLP